MAIITSLFVLGRFSMTCHGTSTVHQCSANGRDGSVLEVTPQTPPVLSAIAAIAVFFPPGAGSIAMNQ